MALIDQGARTRIEDGLDETLFVEAGAGTGKTHQLVQRIINLIVSGAVQANQIAAITFTEKAAAELNDRVQEELDRQREAATDPARRRLFADASEQLDQAAIETLHAFAGRILRLHPIEAELPPGFQIIDDALASLKFSERWQEALDELLEDEELAQPLLDAFDAGIELKHFEAIARAMHEDWDRAEQDSAEMPSGAGPQVGVFVAQLRRVLGERHLCQDLDDRLYKRMELLESFANKVDELKDQPGKLARLLIHSTNTSLKVGNLGSQRNWPGMLRQVRDEMALLNEQREQMRKQIILNISAPVCNAIRRIIVEYADERRRFGELEFQDLLIRASRLLESEPSVAASMRERFQRLLIDEFQDNDPMQTRIIDAIARDEPGRAFFVGDPKQSIYRFRRADIQQFNRVKQEQPAGLTRLTQNFRSTPGVTEFVNAVFRPLMLEGGQDQAEWEDLNAHRGPIPGVEYAVTVIGEGSTGKIDETRVREGEALAQLIASITATPWQAFDKSLDQWRDARFADTAVLVPTRTGLKRLLPALENRDIPYRLESRSLVYSTREIRDLLNVLRAIDDPTDQIALVASLRSPAFACADDDLYRWRQAGGRWDYRRLASQEISKDDPVAESMLWLRETANRRWEMSISKLVGYIIRDRRLMELAVAERHPREHWARYRFILDQARAFCDSGGSTLSEFLTWAEFQADNDTQVIESIVPEEDEDAVRIMTIHAAKGLEFPIVVFAGLNSPPRSVAPPLIWSDSGRPEIRFSEHMESPGFAELWEREEKLQRDEYVRRNYVGATRARDHLVLSLYHKTLKEGAKSKTDAQIIDTVITESVVPCRRLTHEEIPRVPRAERREQPTAVVDTLADRQQWIDEREQAVRRFESIPHESATGVARRARIDAESPGAGRGAAANFEQADDLPPWRRGRAGTAIGRATHAVLQVIDLEHPDPMQIARAARAQATAESVSGNAGAEVQRLVLRATESEAVQEAVSADRHWRELYVAAEVEGVFIDGFIDLLYELPNGHLVVVDYKTDALRRGERVQEAAERYRLQAASYAMILQESLGKQVDRCVLLFLDPGEEVAVPRLDDAYAEIKRLLAGTTADAVPASP